MLAAGEGERPAFWRRARMKASMGVAAKAWSAGVVKVGIVGLVRGWKAQWRRSTAVYLPSGAMPEASNCRQRMEDRRRRAMVI